MSPTTPPPHHPTTSRVGIVGETQAALVRRASLARLGVDVAWTGATPDALPPLDVLFVAVPSAERFVVARDAARRGTSVLVEWPPAPALRDVQALGAVAEEAGVTVGVSRTLRFHPALTALDGPARLVVLRRVVPEGASLLAGHTLAALADLCLFLTHGPALTRLDAQAVRDAARAPRSLAFNLRFQNGAYAQAALHAGAAASLCLHACTAAATHDAELHAPADVDAARDAETRAFLDAAASGQPFPVTPLDALQTLRLVERLWARLR